jgi:hypothetical protein
MVDEIEDRVLYYGVPFEIALVETLFILVIFLITREIYFLLLLYGVLSPNPRNFFNSCISIT